MSKALREKIIRIKEALSEAEKDNHTMGNSLMSQNEVKEVKKRGKKVVKKESEVQVDETNEIKEDPKIINEQPPNIPIEPKIIAEKPNLEIQELKNQLKKLMLLNTNKNNESASTKTLISDLKKEIEILKIPKPKRNIYDNIC